MTRKRAILISIPFALFVATVLTLNFYIFPNLTPWLNKEINSYLKKHTSAQIAFEDIEILFFPPSIRVSKISATNLDSLAPTLKPISIEYIQADLDFIQSLTGILNIRALTIHTVTGEMDLDPFLKSKTETKELPIKDLIDLLNKLPINHIDIESPNFFLNWREKNAKLTLAGHYIRASLETKNQLNLKAHLLSQVLIEDKNHNLDLSTTLRLDEHNLTVQNLNINANGLSIEGKGLLSSFARIAIEPKADLFLKASVDLNKNHFLLKNFVSNEIKNISGIVDVQLQGLASNLKQSTLDFQVDLNNIEFNDYSIGSLNSLGSWREEKIILNKFSLLNSAGKGNLKSAHLDLKKPYTFKAQVEVEQVYLQKLLQNIDLKNIPVELIANGKANCKGQIENFQLNCPVELSGEDIRVATSLNKGVEIIALDDLFLRGQVYFDAEDFKFSSQLSFLPLRGTESDSDFLKNSNNGVVSGNVNYVAGYALNFKTSFLDFNKIKNIADLDLKGKFQLIGSSKGNTDRADFQAVTNTQNFIIKDYYLDQFNTDLQYKNGYLSFQNLNGYLEKAAYNGQVVLNFNNSTLDGGIDFEKAEAEYLTKIFERVYKVPLAVTGTGPLRVKFDGPLDFWKLNFKLQSHFINGKIHSDSFDRLQINAHKENDTIFFDDVYIVKNKSRLTARGKIIGPEPKWNLQFEAAQLRLEESELVSSINSSISGQLNARADLGGTMQNPELKMQSNLVDTFLDEQPLPSSTAEFELTKNLIKGTANVFGNRIQSEFIFPLSNKAGTPLKIRAQTVNWSFNDMLVLFGGLNLKNQYTTDLTASVDLESPTGQFKDLSGQIVIDQILLQRSQQFLKNPKKIIVQIQKGVARLIDFKLSGNDNSIELISDRFTPENFDIEYRVQTSLSLLHIFIPVLDDLNGNIELKAQTRGPLSKPQILGLASIKNGFVKIPNFPHPIEKLDGNIDFSQSKILLNNIRGNLGGGLIQSSGQIRIEGLRDLPMDLTIKVENTTLNVPERFKTSGDLNLKLTGRWFPFLISGQYLVHEAFVDKEFGGDSNSVNLKQSIYLPKNIREQIIEPLILDLQIFLQKNVVVKNSLVDGSIVGNLNIKGTPGNPQILGELSFEKDSKVLFRETPFDVQNGLVKFSDPTEINPDFYITASSRVGEYDVSLLVQGNAKNVNIQPSSVPPLSKQDIFTLLALGMTATNLDQATAGNTVERRQTELAIGSAILSQTGIDKKVKENTGFNVHLGSYFDSTKNVSIPRVTVSRQLRKKLNASYSRTLGDQTQSEARLQYIINNNLSAIGSWQSQEAQEGSSSRFNGLDKEILGIDLEFKRDFK